MRRYIGPSGAYVFLPQGNIELFLQGRFSELVSSDHPFMNKMDRIHKQNESFGPRDKCSHDSEGYVTHGSRKGWNRRWWAER